MGIYQIAAFGVIAAILSVMLKKDNPAFAVMIGIGASVIILIAIVPKLSAVLDLVTDISGKINSSVPFISPILKILGIAYISEFASQITADAGEGAIASKIELAGKVLMMTVSAPIIFALINQVIYLLP